MTTYFTQYMFLALLVVVGGSMGVGYITSLVEAESVRLATLIAAQ